MKKRLKSSLDDTISEADKVKKDMDKELKEMKKIDRKVEKEIEKDKEMKEKVVEKVNEIEKSKETAEEKEEDEKKVIKKKIPVPKPVIDEETRKAMEMRKMKKIPEFHRQEWLRYKKLGDSWRQPRGGHSKLRRHLGYRPNVVSIGYRGPRMARGLHPSGFREIMVYNINDIKKIDPKREAARIGRTVGTKKRVEIEKMADGLGIRILNRLR